MIEIKKAYIVKTNDVTISEAVENETVEGYLLVDTEEITATFTKKNGDVYIFLPVAIAILDNEIIIEEDEREYSFSAIAPYEVK